MPNLIEFVEADGFALKKTASTNGGEYHCPCPWCGGDDRFTVWPEQEEYGKYWCRQCDKSGDTIQYLMDCRGLSFKEAADLVGKSLNDNFTKKTAGKKHMNQEWIPKEKKQPPPAVWQEKIKRVIEVTHNHLINDEALVEQLYKERGLTLNTIKLCKLGVNDKNKYRKRLDYGLPKELNDKDKPKKLYFPVGLVIPLFCPETGEPLSIRIRRSNPTECEKYGPYYILPGSKPEPMVIKPKEELAGPTPVIIVESDLDAILLAQEIDKPLVVVALGSAQQKPHVELTHQLRQAPYIIVALDSDQPGYEATEFWLQEFSNSAWFPVPVNFGKDPGDAYQNNLDLNLWFQAALMAVESNSNQIQ